MIAEKQKPMMAQYRYGLVSPPTFFFGQLSRRQRPELESRRLWDGLSINLCLIQVGLADVTEPGEKRTGSFPSNLSCLRHSDGAGDTVQSVDGLHFCRAKLAQPRLSGGHVLSSSYPLTFAGKPLTSAWMAADLLKCS